MKKRKLVGAAAALVVMAASVSSVYAYDEYLNDYNINSVTVSANRINNHFGDTITEQSYYRTGGDVKVITRDEINKRHYADITDAIKRVPGVTFQNPGYRGGEYGYQFYNNGVLINGDTHVVILVNGRRVDNAASTRVGYNTTKGTKSTGVSINEIASIDNVDKIEVIKGPGASVYGSDASGGVINIITRSGGDVDKGSINLSAGSWGRKDGSIVYGGSNEAKDFHYMVTASQTRSNNTKYVDPFTEKEATLVGSYFNEKSASLRLDKDLDNGQKITFSYDYKTGKDGYPIATPNMKYWNKKDWDRIIFDAIIGKVDDNNKVILHKKEITEKDKDGKEVKKMVDTNSRLYGDPNNPGYHNLYSLDGNYGSNSQFTNHDAVLTYTFRTDHDMPSFLRVYYQDHKLGSIDKFQWVDSTMSYRDFWTVYNKEFPNGATAEQKQAFIEKYFAPFPGDKDALAKWIEKTGGYVSNPNTWYTEKVTGADFQWAQSIQDKHDIILGLSYANASQETTEKGEVTGSLKTKSFSGYVQDKIHVNDNWDITPSIRFEHRSNFSSFDKGDGNSTIGEGHTAVTGALNTQFRFDKDTTGYFGATNIYRPNRPYDAFKKDTITGSPLTPEKGMVYTVGLRHFFDHDTVISANYYYQYMSNAHAKLPVENPDKAAAKDNPYITAIVNAREAKQAVNVTLDKYIGTNWIISTAYTHMSDKWMAKDGWNLGPQSMYENSADINTAINTLTPKHRISLNVAYEKGKLYTGLLTNFYLGCSEYAFTSPTFIVLDWSLNYNFNKDMTGYVVVNNLTNTAYQTSFNAYNGLGSSSMPAREVRLGFKYKF